MTIHDTTRALFASILLIGVACGDDDGTTPPTDAGGGTDTGTTMMQDSGPSDTDAGPTGGDFTFRTDDPASYTRVDRMGMPAVSTALITMKDLYNDDDPTDDLTPPTAPWKWGVEIIANLSALHEALEEDLTNASLAGCANYALSPVDASDCVLQPLGGGAVANLVIPDTITVNTAAPAGFPNGRQLPDAAMDRTLSVVLLDLRSATGCAGGPCTPTTLEGLPLNPTSNDVVFEVEFPYLAAPHAM